MKRLQEALESVKNEFTVHSKAGSDLLEKQGEFFEEMEADVDDMKLIEKAQHSIEQAMAPIYKYLEGTDENLSNFGDKKAKPFKKEK